MKIDAFGIRTGFVTQAIQSDGCIVMAGMRIHLDKAVTAQVNDLVTVKVQRNENGLWTGAIQEHLGNPLLSAQTLTPVSEMSQARDGLPPLDSTTNTGAPPAASSPTSRAAPFSNRHTPRNSQSNLRGNVADPAKTPTHTLDSDSYCGPI